MGPSPEDVGAEHPGLNRPPSPSSVGLKYRTLWYSSLRAEGLVLALIKCRCKKGIRVRSLGIWGHGLALNPKVLEQRWFVHTLHAGCTLPWAAWPESSGFWVSEAQGQSTPRLLSFLEPQLLNSTIWDLRCSPIDALPSHELKKVNLECQQLGQSEASLLFSDLAGIGLERCLLCWLSCASDLELGMCKGRIFTCLQERVEFWALFLQRFLCEVRNRA